MEDMSFIKNPSTPITKTPSRQIFMESQSSLLPGFLASLSNLVHDLRNDLNPKFARSLNIHFPYKNVFCMNLGLITTQHLEKPLSSYAKSTSQTESMFKPFQGQEDGAFVFVDHP